jgi:hypothetical protein
MLVALHGRHGRLQGRIRTACFSLARHGLKAVEDLIRSRRRGHGG